MEAKTLGAKLRFYEALSDAEVVARVLAGDHPLFELLMRRYNRRLFRYARGILNDDGLAQDAVQEAYLNVFRNLHQFRGPQGFGAWLMRITTRSAIRIGRKESGIKLVTSTIDPQDLSDETSIQPERATINVELAHSLEQALDRLPRDFRLVFILRELEGMSIDETALTLGVKPATVKTRLHRARNLLSASFKNRLEELRSLAYAFAGARCDAIVRQVFLKLESSSNQNGRIE